MEPIQLELVHASSLHKSTRTFYPPKIYLGIIIEDVKKMFLTSNGVYGDDPKTYDEAMSDIDFEKWLGAMKSKIDSMCFKSSLDLRGSTSRYCIYLV